MHNNYITYIAAKAMYMQRHKAEQQWKCHASCDAYSTANQLRMAARRTLEVITMFEGLAGFTYEISYLFLQGYEAKSGQKAWVCSKLWTIGRLIHPSNTPYPHHLRTLMNSTKVQNPRHYGGAHSA